MNKNNVNIPKCLIFECTLSLKLFYLGLLPLVPLPSAEELTPAFISDLPMMTTFIPACALRALRGLRSL